ncbi:MAG: S8 family serine peptidase [Deltaproteobacteria bacterium]|nr:S8 family serine peptidase [Deltaproteobacteria bacterium]
MHRTCASRYGLPALALGAALGLGAGGARGNGAADRVTGSTGPQQLYVVLDGPPAAEIYAAAAGLPHAQRVARTRARLAEIQARQAALRPLLAAAGVTVVAELGRLANAVQVLAPPQAQQALRRLPGVVRLDPVPIYRPDLLSAVPLVGAPAVWAQHAAGSEGLLVQGEGIRIGIVDSGIDYTHADFGGSGNPADYAGNDRTLVEPGTFPTSRVVGGRDLVGDGYDASSQGSAVPKPDDDPLDCADFQEGQMSGGHGTHVAGIAAGGGVRKDGTPFAGPYEQSLDRRLFRVGPGVAPRAALFAIKIFGCKGSTAMLGQALELAADPDEDGDFADRLDVVNASLGSSYDLGSATQQQIVHNLAVAGSLFVAAAGNDGSTFLVVASPASYPDVLAVAASYDLGVVTLRVLAPPALAGELPAAEGDFTVPLGSTGPITGKIVKSSPVLACGELANPGALAGNIALLDRGSCPFTEKIERVAQAGAIAAVVVDNEDHGAPFPMSGDKQVSIPGVMIRLVDGQAIAAVLGQGVVATLDPQRFSAPGAEPVAGFSSRGPSATASLCKPELTAPGAPIESAAVGTGTEARTSGGTSMACPMVSGAAALVRQARPDLLPREVKARLMGSAVPLLAGAGQPYPVSLLGAGRLDVARAVATEVAAWVIEPPAQLEGATAVSFGALVAAVPQSTSRQIEVVNRGPLPAHYLASAQPDYPLPGVKVSVAPAQLTVPAGGSATLWLGLALDPLALGAPGPDPLTPLTQYDQPRHWLVEAAGLVRLVAPPEQTGGGLVLPFHATVRAAAARRAGEPVASCAPGPGREIAIPIAGPSAHPAPVVTAFELGATSPARSSSSTDPASALLDLRAVGAATSYATAESFAATSVSFGVAIEGQWATPARGPLSAVGVLLDTDLDGHEEYAIFAEALTRDGPYADVLAATTYNLAKQTALENKRFLNLVPADEHDTQPFYNGVLVLGVSVADLGLSEEEPSFNYKAFTMSAEEGYPGESTDWVRFDPTRPVLDPARGAPVPGRPMYVGDEPVRVHIEPEAAGGEPLPELLLLHHTNVAGQRWETVSLAEAGQGRLAISHEAPREVSPGRPFWVTVTATNEGDADLDGVAVEASLSGAVVDWSLPSQGSCRGDGAPSCGIGLLAPGQAVTVTLQAVAGGGVLALAGGGAGGTGAAAAGGAGAGGGATASGAAGGAPQVALWASASSQGECAVETSASIPVRSKRAGRAALAAAGGCACRVGDAAPPGGSSRLALLAVLVGLCLAAWRRRAR